MCSVKCAMCAGRGCEPALNDITNRWELIRCEWCDGTGETEAQDALPACESCGAEQMGCPNDFGGTEAYCANCTRFKPTTEDVINLMGVGCE